MHNGFVITERMMNNKKYNGNSLKLGITVDGQDYLVKFSKDTVSSVYSEYVASRFIKGIGLNCQEAWLGWLNKQLVVIVKDFSTKDAKLRSYKSTRQSSEGTDLSNKTYTYKDVLYLINKHTKMSEADKQKTIRQFWDMFICDAILGNRDRHHENWGYLDYKTGYKPAPIYDNGGSLFPGIESRMAEYIALLKQGKEYKFIAERSERFPASLFQMERADGQNRRTNYYEILSDLRINKVLAAEVRNIREKVGFNRVYEAAIRAVASVKGIIPWEYRRFYVLIICTRYLHMVERKSIKESYLISVRRLNDEVRQW